MESLAPDQVFTPEDFDEDQDQVRKTTLRFMSEEVLPRVADLENKQPGLARQFIEQAAELGLLGVLVPAPADGRCRRHSRR